MCIRKPNEEAAEVKGALLSQDWHCDRPSTRLQRDTPTRETTNKRDKGNTKAALGRALKRQPTQTKQSASLSVCSSTTTTHILATHLAPSSVPRTHTHSSSRLLQQSQYEDLSPLYPLPNDGCTMRAAATGITLVTRELSTSSLSLSLSQLLRLAV